MSSTTSVARVVIALVIAGACSSSIEPWLTPAVAAHDVLVTATDSGATSEGRIILVSVRNQATTPAYARNCGGPALGLQVFERGGWEPINSPAIACVFGPPTVQLPAGEELTIRRALMLSGHYRFVMGVATSADLGDETVATSNSFTLP
jgi:hypothetical protein